MSFIAAFFMPLSQIGIKKSPTINIARDALQIIAVYTL